jgi:hypothetical protein
MYCATATTVAPVGLKLGVAVQLQVKLCPDATAKMGQFAPTVMPCDASEGSVMRMITPDSLTFIGAGFVTRAFPVRVNGATLPSAPFGSVRVTRTV